MFVYDINIVLYTTYTLLNISGQLNKLNNIFDYQYNVYKNSSMIDKEFCYMKVYGSFKFKHNPCVRAIPVKFTWEGRNADDFFYYRWGVTDSFYSGGLGW